jgi:hypothetical protein
MLHIHSRAPQDIHTVQKGAQRLSLDFQSVKPQPRSTMQAGSGSNTMEHCRTWLRCQPDQSTIHNSRAKASHAVLPCCHPRCLAAPRRCMPCLWRHQCDLSRAHLSASSVKHMSCRLPVPPNTLQNLATNLANKLTAATACTRCTHTQFICTLSTLTHMPRERG